MSYSLLQLGSDTRRRALSGLQQSAAREEQREQANENLKQAERQQTMSAVGTGASIGMMAYGPWVQQWCSSGFCDWGVILMALDTRGFVDGALQGFQVAEGHYQRKKDNERQDRLDERDEQRYQYEKQDCLSWMNKIESATSQKLNVPMQT